MDLPEIDFILSSLRVYLWDGWDWQNPKELERKSRPRFILVEHSICFLGKPDFTCRADLTICGSSKRYCLLANMVCVVSPRPSLALGYFHHDRHTCLSWFRIGTQKLAFEDDTQDMGILGKQRPLVGGDRTFRMLPGSCCIKHTHVL